MSRLQEHTRAYLFDVDGVLTNPRTKRIELGGIVTEIDKRLVCGHIVGFNTGRSLPFVKEHVIDYLVNNLGNPSLLHNVVAIGEKGAAWSIYDKNGNEIREEDDGIRIPGVLYDRVTRIVQNPIFSETMFMDHSKKTMVTVEMESQANMGRHTFSDFQRRQELLKGKLEEELSIYGYQDQYRVDSTRIATDIENRSVGKAKGARKYVEEIRRLNFMPEEFICFGDSPSDYDMYAELTQMGIHSTFVFVGGNSHLDLSRVDLRNRSNIIFTTQLIDQGTLEYLKQEQF